MELTPDWRTIEIIMKTIKLTTEQAKQLYAKDQTFRETILHEFTDEELGIEPKPFTWYDLGEQNKGAYIKRNSDILEFNSWLVASYNRNVYPCREDAEQALAKCMVLNLARYYNGCEQHEIEGVCYKPYYSINMDAVGIFKSRGLTDELVKFIRIEDLQKCIKDNEDLFKKMSGVNK